MKLKLMTAGVLSVLMLGSTQVSAHHKDDYKEQDKYHRHGHSKYEEKARHHHKKAVKHYQKAHRYYAKHSRYDRRSDRHYTQPEPYERYGYRNSYGEVISVEPVYRSYSRPVADESCLRRDSHRSYGTRASHGYSTGGANYTAPILGAVIGGALGHRIGDAHGDPEVAAVAGGLLGASIGHSLGRNMAYNRGLQVDGPCRVQHRSETVRELVEYKVAYRYNGQVHHARMDYDPGEWIKLDVEVAPA